MGFQDTFSKTCDGVARVGRLLTTFDGRPITAKKSSLSEYPATDKPLVIHIWGIKTPREGVYGQFHGCASYDGVVINSNGFRDNTGSIEGTVRNNAIIESQVFVLSPEKMGLSPEVLKKNMIVESRKKKDYNLFADNCVDHLVRPMQAAGSDINFGMIATPRELSEWCEKAVNSGKGVLISAEEYQRALKDKTSIVYHAPQQSLGNMAAKSR